MTENSSRRAETEQRGRHGAPFRGIAGLIEGSMMILREPGGALSFRVLIGVDGEQTAECDLLELIIDAEHIADLGKALAGYGAGRAADLDPALLLPCHIGYCKNAVSAAA
jgi:hypothetical protein